MIRRRQTVLIQAWFRSSQVLKCFSRNWMLNKMTIWIMKRGKRMIKNRLVPQQVPRDWPPISSINKKWPNWEIAKLRGNKQNSLSNNRNRMVQTRWIETFKETSNAILSKTKVWHVRERRKIEIQELQREESTKRWWAKERLLSKSIKEKRRSTKERKVV